jgi:hypothetical protein
MLFLGYILSLSDNFGAKMQKNLIETLVKWPKTFITGADLKVILDKSYDSRHSIIKRITKEGLLIKIRNDLYIIKPTLKNDLPDKFELAQLIWGPSYISFESALSYHRWIPEAVYTITSACSKKGRNIDTPIGIFSYEHIPIDIFSIGLHHHNKDNVSYLIAHPWKAIADLIYARKKTWSSLSALSGDLRIELEDLHNSDKELLEFLSKSYPSSRTRKILHQFFEEL